MSIMVNGHQLPPLLVKLIEDKRWEACYLPVPALNKMFRNVGLASVDQALQTAFAWEMEDILSSIFSPKIENPLEQEKLFEQQSVASSNELGYEVEDAGIIDIDNTVFIAYNNAGNIICLDYRENPENPCVRAYIQQEGEIIVDWRMIAPDFETFARELGLVE